MYGHHFVGFPLIIYVWSSLRAEYGHQPEPSKVANPAHDQLNRENEYFPVPVRA